MTTLHHRSFGCFATVSTAALLFGCGGDAGAISSEPVDEVGMSFEEFETRTYREPETGLYIVDGDTPIESREALQEFYARSVREGALIVHQANGEDARWNDAQKMNLTYCVSQSFGASYAGVVSAMAAAAAAWEEAASINFVHAAAEDGACNAANANVIFDVRPTSGQPYLARAFFPNFARDNRNILIDASAFDTSPPLTVEGILRHELGHALGFRHEHTRPEAGVCFEDSSWRALTPYDSASVMHYPQCNGTNSWELSLSNSDKAGAASLYGAVDQGPVVPPNPTDGQVCVTVQQGVSGAVEDATIWQNAPSWNDSVNPTLGTGSSSAGVRQSLLRFDLSGVPVGATVLSSSLTLLQQQKSTSSTVSVHRVVSPWSAADVSWSSFGGGYDPTPAATMAVGIGLDTSAIGGDSGLRSADLGALTQAWVGGSTPNHGVLLTEPASDRTTFKSSDVSEVAPRPRLDVCYVTCDDGIQNGAETGVDCGGPCAPCCGTYLQEDFSDNNQGWTLGPEWGIGPATASPRGVLGGDPGFDHTETDDNGVAGVVIGGNAARTLHGYYYLTSPTFDATARSGNITLSYHRWLNSDYTPFMRNRVEVWNGSTWVTIWQSGSQAISDTSWRLMTHNLTPYKNAQMRIRFGFTITNQGVWSVSSWNLDDIAVSDAGCSPWIVSEEEAEPEGGEPTEPRPIEPE